jgi:hypothetical protein
MNAGYELVNMLPYAKEEANKMMKAVVNSVAGAVQEGKLTPEMAQQKWIEYISYMRLVQRFEQQVRVVQATAIDTNPITKL